MSQLWGIPQPEYFVKSLLEPHQTYFWKHYIYHKEDTKVVVFGLGRIFRLERSVFFMAESAARAWGHKFSSEAMHVYMGEKRFSLWSYHIGTVFKSIQLSFDIYRFSNHHLVHDIHQMIGGLHNLFKFQWAITSCLSYVEYWPENIKTCLPPCGG